jgi:DNA topoisomerase-1
MKIKIRSYHKRNHINVRSHSRGKPNVPPGWKKVTYYDDQPYFATGIDKKGRKQYLYPVSFSKRTSKKKFSRIERLEEAIPGIIENVKKDVHKEIPEAEATYAIYATGFRPGTERDTKADVQAYGVSTLEKDQVEVSGNVVKFDFIGKKGVHITKNVSDRLLASIVKKRQTSNKLFDTSDVKIRKYFDKKTRGRYHLKDLRTLKAQQVARNTLGGKKAIGESVSKELGNTPAVALESYVDPKLVEQ